MIGHDDEIVEGETSGTNTGAEDVDQEGRVAVGLEQAFAHVCFGGHEERAIGLHDLCGVGIAGGNGHGLKPGVIFMAFRRG